MAKKQAAMADFTRTLSGDVDRWVDEAFKKLLQVDPRFEGLEAGSQLDFADETETNGLGRILIRQGDVVVQIPFFVRDGQMEPIDLFVYEGTTYPLTPDRIQDLLFVEGGFAALSREPDGENRNRLGDSPPPEYKFASLLDRVLPRVSTASIRACVERLDQETLVKMADRKKLPLLDKLAHRTEAPSPALPTRAWRVKMASPGHYQVERFLQVRGDPPERLQLVGEEAPVFFQKVGHEGILDRVDAHGGVAIFPHQEAETQPLIDGQIERLDVEVQDKLASGPAVVVDVQGQGHEGVLFQVYDYDGRCRPERMFIGSKVSAVGRVVPGMTDDAEKGAAVLQEADPTANRQQRAGRAGDVVWAWQEGDKWGATPPFKIAQLLRSEKGRTNLVGQDALGRSVNFIISDDVQCITPVEKVAGTRTISGPNYLVPGSYRLLYVPPATLLMKTAAAIREELFFKAAESLGGEVVVINRAGRIYNTFLRNDGACMKAASQMLHARSFTPEEFRLALACCGVNEKTAQDIMSVLHEEGTVVIRGLHVPELAGPQKVARDRSKLDALLATVEGIRPALWKLAAELDEDGLSDQLVGLNFIEERTIDDFMEALPILEHSVQVLAEMLVQARTEKIDIPPEAIRQAMVSMDEVLHGLQVLDAE